ncbi:hypothetical protein J6590_027694 [Homalodisca vitripennis]|nr:hypothetical protein J6590_027694 [Homalodisca vitripennis]
MGKKNKQGKPHLPNNQPGPAVAKGRVDKNQAKGPFSKNKHKAIKEQINSSSFMSKNKGGNVINVSSSKVEVSGDKPLSKNARRKLRKLQAQQKQDDVKQENYIPLSSPQKKGAPNGIFNKNKNKQKQQFNISKTSELVEPVVHSLTMSSDSDSYDDDDDDDDDDDEENDTSNITEFTIKSEKSTQTDPVQFKDDDDKESPISHKRTKTGKKAFEKNLVTASDSNGKGKLNEEFGDKSEEEDTGDEEETGEEEESEEEEEIGEEEDMEEDESGEDEDEKDEVHGKDFLDDEAEEGEESSSEGSSNEEESRHSPPTKKMKYSPPESENVEKHSSTKKVFINNLPTDADEEKLRKALTGIENFTKMTIVRSKDNPDDCRGFAFLELQDEETFEHDALVRFCVERAPYTCEPGSRSLAREPDPLIIHHTPTYLVRPVAVFRRRLQMRRAEPHSKQWRIRLGSPEFDSALYCPYTDGFDAFLGESSQARKPDSQRVVLKEEEEEVAEEVKEEEEEVKEEEEDVEEENGVAGEEEEDSIEEEEGTVALGGVEILGEVLRALGDIGMAVMGRDHLVATQEVEEVMALEGGGTSEVEVIIEETSEAEVVIEETSEVEGEIIVAEGISEVVASVIREEIKQ